MSTLTRADLEEILDEFINNQNSAFEHSPVGKNISDITNYLKDIKQGIQTICGNTGPDGAMSPRNISAVLSAVDHERSNNNAGGGGQGNNNNDADNIKKFNKELENSKSNYIKSLKGVTTSVIKFTSGITKSLDLILKQLDMNNTTYNELNKAGMSWSNSASAMALDINKAGFTVQEFTKILNSSSGNLRALGGAQFLEFSSRIEKTNAQLGDFGMGADEYYKQAMAQADYMRLNGNIQELNNTNIGNSFHELIGKTNALTSAFGTSVEDLMKAKKELQTSEVSRAMVHDISNRTGIDEQTINTRLSILKNISPELAQSTARSLLGFQDATSARNRDTIGAAATFIASRNDEQSLDNYRRMIQEGVRQSNIDASRFSGASLSAIQDTDYIKSRSDINDRLYGLRDSSLTGEQYTRELQNMNGDASTIAVQTLPYNRFQRDAAIQSISNTQLNTFSRSITETINVLNNLYSKQYPIFADKLNDATKSLASFDNQISSFIHEHQNELAQGMAMASVPGMIRDSIMGNLAISAVGGAAGIYGAVKTSRKMKKIYNNIKTNGPKTSAGASEETILAGEQTSDMVKSGRFSKLGRLGKFGGKTLGLLGAGLSLYDLYSTNSEINTQEQSGEINHDQANKEKWENWGSSLGGIAGGIGGAALGAGIASIPLSIAGGIAGNYIGKGLGWSGYELSSMFNNTLTEPENVPVNTNNNRNNIRNIDHNNTDREMVEILSKINNGLVQLNRTNQQMLKNLNNISPYSGP